jgi:hypothetical protein
LRRRHEEKQVLKGFVQVNVERLVQAGVERHGEDVRVGVVAAVALSFDAGQGGGGDV